MIKICIAAWMLAVFWIAIIICGFHYGWQTDLPVWINYVFSGCLGIITTLLVCGVIEEISE